MRYRLMLGILLCLLTIVPTFAQSNEVVISLAILEYEIDDYREIIIPQFEAQNPGVRVHLDTTGGYNELYWNPDVNWYLDNVSKLAHQTDVFSVNQYLQRDATRTGYILDLAPLVRSDMTINQDRYYPNTWESFSWDGGVWAIPSSFDPYIMLYNREVFDEVGLPYPDMSWDVYDFADAIRALTKFNEDGTITKQVVEFSGRGSQTYFLLSLMGGGIYSDNGLQLDQNRIQEVLDVWTSLGTDGYFNEKQDNASSGMMVVASSEMQTPSLTIIPSSYAQYMLSNPNRVGLSALPNNYVGSDIVGYAVSGGTLYPEQSYQLAKFLANHPRVIDNQFSGRAAYLDVGVDETASDMRSSFMTDRLSPEFVTLIDDIFNNHRSMADHHFFDYMVGLFQDIIYATDTRDYTLDDLGGLIEERLNLGQERANSPVMVAPPPVEVELAPGKIALNFGLTSNTSPFPYREQWDRFISEFSANDPTVGHVVLDTAFARDLEYATQRYDCFYLPDNSVFNDPNANLSSLLSLDPFISTDSSNVMQDFVYGVVERTQRNGQTVGFPLTIRGEYLIYNPELFQQANAGDPRLSWTVSDFENALWALKGIMEDDRTPFEPMLFTTHHLFLLIMAYGGNPFDYSTTPPTFNFTDEATINATKQVLDLVRNGLMNYTDLGVTLDSFSFGSDNSAPLYTSSMGGGMSVISMTASGDFEYIVPETYMIPYPSGSLYTPVSFQVGAAYISASSDYADECYRFIRAISQEPDLFIGDMPALQSVINSPELITAHNQVNVDFYRQYAEQLQQPSTLILPDVQMAYYISGLSEISWVYRVFDDYVKNGDVVDFESELIDAQAKMDEQTACVSQLQDMMTIETEEEFEAYIKGYELCIQMIDPTFEMPNY